MIRRRGVTAVLLSLLLPSSVLGGDGGGSIHSSNGADLVVEGQSCNNPSAEKNEGMELGVNDSHLPPAVEDDDLTITYSEHDNEEEEGASPTELDEEAEEQEETVTIELGEDLMHRIHAALEAAGVVNDNDKRIHEIAMAEVHKWHAEEEQHKELRQEYLSRKFVADNPEPQTEFPYVLTPPSANIMKQIHKWKPPGGGRYSEYASGHSPYIVKGASLQQQSDDLARIRRTYIKQAMQHAWAGYTKYAFGDDEVRPQSRKGTNHWGGIGVTLVDSLDTLWIMGMHEEFEQARDYVRDDLSHDQDRKVSVFETTIRSLGGLLSAFDWSRDEVFLEEAMDLARRLMRAFDHPITGDSTVLPFGEVNLQDGSCNMIPWAGGNAILSEFGTLQIEFRYLDEIMQTRETLRFREKVESIFEMLHEMSPANGLFPYYMKTSDKNNDNKRKRTTKRPRPSTKPYFSNDHITFGAMADSFYEYMLKIWLQGGKAEPMYRDMYDKAMQGMHDELLHISKPSGLTYLADRVTKGGKRRTHHKMDHLCCFVGGMLALGAYTDPLGLDSPRAQRDLQTAKALTYTCYQMYARMKTGISPEFVEFVPGEDFQVGKIAPHYLLRPEAVESFYILNALTGDPIYREWGWEVFLSIEKYCKTHVAYGALRDVQKEGTAPRDEMESFFLAETLKYLYLLNDPDTEIDILNKHVFNTEAHPMRMFPVMEEEMKQEALEAREQSKATV